MAGLGCTVAGLLLLLVGLFIAIGGPLLIPVGMGKALKDQIVVDSTSSPTYDDWAGGYDKKMPYQMIFYMWNLTNAEDVRLNTAKPVYESAGPYVFRRYRQAIDVEFLNNGNQVKFANFKDYIFDSNSSVGLETDMFTNINPVFMAVVTQATSETGVPTLLATPIVQQAIDFFTGPFIPLLGLYNFSTIFNPLMNFTLTSIEASLGDKQKARAYFLNAWVNATEVPQYGGLWTSLLISNASGVPSGISAASAEKLLDPSVNNSLLATDAATAAWNWHHARENTVIALSLMEAFNLTKAQLEAVISWREHVFAPQLVLPLFMSKYGVSNLTDLGWVQWNSADVTDQTSVCTLWPLISPTCEDPNQGMPWEFYFWAYTQSNVVFPTWQDAKFAMNKTSGLLNTYVFQEFALYYSAMHANGTYTKWGITDIRIADEIFGYHMQLGQYQVPVLVEKYGPSGGLFRTKSVVDWIFNCQDYITDILAPNGPPCSIVVNHTAFPATTINTGKDDVKKINTYVKWREQSVIETLWAGPLNVEGHTELGQFQPGLKHEDVVVFDPNFVRPLPLKYRNSTSIKGIDADSYYLDYQSVLAPSDFYYQREFGFANMTSFENQAPVFLSLWDMMHAPNRHDYVDGLANYTDEIEYNTVIDIEPTTGNTVRSRKRVQVNIGMPSNASAWFQSSAFGNDHVRVGLYYPLMRAAEFITVSDDLADMIKDKLQLLPTATHDLFWVFVSVGPAIAFLGAIMTVIGIRRRRAARDYEIIN